jgi:hypothetical protein
VCGGAIGRPTHEVNVVFPCPTGSCASSKPLSGRLDSGILPLGGVAGRAPWEKEGFSKRQAPLSPPGLPQDSRAVQTWKSLIYLTSVCPGDYRKSSVRRGSFFAAFSMAVFKLSESDESPEHTESAFN